jgi:DNA-binding NarL/FixJ family response regulator
LESPRSRRPALINLIIADHQPVFRAGIAKLLAAEDDMRIIAQPLSIEHLLNAVEKLRSHVVILSSGFLPDLDGLRKIAGVIGERAIAILLLADNTEKATQFAGLNIQGLFYRSISGEMLIAGVRRLAAGGCYLQTHAADQISQDLVGARVTSQLCRRELAIIAAVVQGYKNREIAEQLGAAVSQIKNSLRDIFDKTGVSGRLELALFVLHHQVLAQAAAAHPPLQPQTTAQVNAAHAVKALFYYSPPKTVRLPQSSPNQPANQRNHAWYHPSSPNCGK